ncbi:hypothetical protein BST36_20230 [Mycolicibacterium moriokaense]|uniref:Luciferase-like monooxygenase n=1 Tax=Mycolicibacterium moriokaense TaxID=39691 RepID=A0AAD1H8W1_9MYCO|nr:hypothetical protein BST36_20230 [Mycolicibacterium moriokaense]BBX00174.1 hypothetical protein MMOR_11100 [Mycolicibacterium moriokaense]
MAIVRLFVADDAAGHWSELTDGVEPAVRVVADDLLQAKRARARIRADSDDVSVILDLTVAVAADFRSARTELGSIDGVRYAGTVDGLAGLIADIETAGVADGVTLIAASPDQDLHALGLDVLDWLTIRGQARAS